MAEAIDFEPDSAFEIVEPKRLTAPLIFNSPHSGSRYPSSFLAKSRLDERAVRQSEDVDVDELFAAATSGAPLLRAHFPRAWLDVNREPFELDPGMFSERLPTFANTGSARVASGLGTIPRVVADGKAIYSGALSIGEALARIESVYVPYHRALRRLIDRSRAIFGFAILIDCHSMPSTVRMAHLRRRPDFVLGDRHGSSCDSALTDAIEAALVRRGYDVSRNRPYAGGFITEHYGQPKDGTHAIQIEVNRALYLDERSLRRSKGYAVLRDDIAGLIGMLIRDSSDLINRHREAAE
jgi:N-formylglutamate amidohydrolase